jgi:hypothetical protein
MSQSISEGESFVDAPNLMFKSEVLSLWRIPNWQDAACAYIECGCSTSTGNGWSLWKGIFMSSKTSVATFITSLLGCIYRHRRQVLLVSDKKGATMDCSLIGTFRPDRIRSIADRFGVDGNMALENILYGEFAISQFIMLP